MAVATFAAGCFWYVQHVFHNKPGVLETTAGYMGGSTSSPTYEQVSKGETGHVEAVQIKYDPAQVSYEQLLEVFWQRVARITIWELGSPTGQYAPIIFTHSDEQYSAAYQSLIRVRKRKHALMAAVTSIFHATEFWPESDQEHQHYYQKHPEKLGLLSRLHESAK